MSIGWICSVRYADGIHLVRRISDNKEFYVFVSEYNLVVKDCRNMETVNVEDFTHIKYYEDGSYYECEDHSGQWLFDDGANCTSCLECDELYKELTSYRLSDSIYRYNSNIELRRIIELLDGLVSYGTDSDKWYETSEAGIIVSHSEWGEFDTHSTTFCTIIDVSVLNK